MRPWYLWAAVFRRMPLLSNLSLSVPLIVLLIVVLYKADRNRLGTVVITSEVIWSLDRPRVVENKEANQFHTTIRFNTQLNELM